MLLALLSMEVRGFASCRGQGRGRQLGLTSSAGPDTDWTATSPRRVGLAELVSSPERYADALGLTVAEVQSRSAAHLRASRMLHHRLEDPDVPSGTKNVLQCEHLSLIHI